MAGEGDFARSEAGHPVPGSAIVVRVREGKPIGVGRYRPRRGKAAGRTNPMRSRKSCSGPAMVSFAVSEAGHSGRIIPGRCWPGFVRPNRQTTGPVHPAAEAGTTDGTRDRRSSPVAAADPARDVHPAGGSYASGGQRPDVAAQADAGLVGSCEADVSRPSCGPMGRTAWSCSLLGLSMRDWGKPRISSLGLSRMLESDPFRGPGSGFGRRRVRREIFVVCPVAAGGSTWVTPGRGGRRG